METTLVCGAGGFIGSHLVTDLKRRGFWVRGVDLHYPFFGESDADEFVIGDLTDPEVVRATLDRRFTEVYQLAADMGGAGYIFTGEHDADVMHNSATINLNVARQAVAVEARRLFYSSSACIYPERNQLDPDNPDCAENSAYPAEPDSEYGWEKLFSERMYLAYRRNYGLDVRIARFHNIFGPLGTWTGGREKAPAALCRKVARGRTRRRDRDLGRRQADTDFPLRRGVLGRSPETDGQRLRRAGEHRLRRDGDHSRSGGDDLSYRQEERHHQARRGSPRRSRSFVGQSTDPGGARLGAHSAFGGRVASHVRMDRGAGRSGVGARCRALTRARAVA